MTQNAASVALAISASAVLSVVVKATVVLATGLLLTKAMHRTRAARRFVVLAWTFAVLSAVPIVGAVAPVVPVVVREIRQQPASPEQVSVNPIERRRRSVPAQAAAVPAPSDAARFGSLALTLWGVGTVVSLVPVLMALWRLRTLRMTALAWNHVPCNVGAQVLIHERVTAPITFGWRRPCVLLPRDAERWPVASVHCALVHEMEHVERRDWPVHVLARIACSVYWFHPLVWVAWRQLHLEADRACDDAVASRCDAHEFAEQLLTLAGRIRSGVPSPLLSMAGGNLVTRVNALLNPNQARGRSGHPFAVAISLCAMLVGAAIASVEAVERIMIVPVSAGHAADASPPPPPAPRPVVVERQTIAQTNRPLTAAPSVRRDSQPAIQSPSSPAPASAPANYVIGVGDTLSITYWEQKELTGDYAVRPDGKITVPLLNDIEAAGLTPEQLRDRLTAVSARIFANPQITVGVREITSRTVYIVGGIVKPGRYDLVGGMTVMQLISVAGGLRDFTVGRGITILRNEDGEQRVFAFDYRAVISGRNLEQNITLRPGDTVAVPD